MTDISSIPSTQIAKGSSSAQAGGSASTGVTANFAGGGNFWDMIFSNLLIGNTKAAATTGLTNPVLTADAAKAEANPMALLQIALSNQTIDENGNIVLPDAANDAKSLESSLELTNNLINHLKNVLPEGAQKEGIFAQVLSKLQARSETLQADITALSSGTLSKETPLEDIPMPLMIALGLSPSEIAQISDNIKALEEKLGREITIEDLIAGVGNLIPQQPQAQVVAGTQAALPVIDENTEATDDLAAQLNALNVGGEETPVEEAAPTLKPAPKTAGDLRADLEIEGTEDIDGHVTHADAKKAAMNFKENLTAANQSAKPQAVTGTGGEILIPVAAFTVDNDTTMWQQLGVAPSSSLNLSPAAQAAAMTSGQTQAGQPHPATQLVAATMTRAGKEGVADTMTLQLDPPELGTVNIRLEFGKDKTVKAHLTVEKAETYLMLQRDGMALERALQNAGLDANSNSISFELAQGGTGDDFRNDGQGGGERNFGGKANGAEEAAETINSTMTWSVDSSTGHVRYNILA